MMVDRPKLPTDAEIAVAAVIMALMWAAAFSLTVLPWLIGIAWMANHWLGIGG